MVEQQFINNNWKILYTGKNNLFYTEILSLEKIFQLRTELNLVKFLVVVVIYLF